MITSRNFAQLAPAIIRQEYTLGRRDEGHLPHALHGDGTCLLLLATDAGEGGYRTRMSAHRIPNAKVTHPAQATCFRDDKGILRKAALRTRYFAFQLSGALAVYSSRANQGSETFSNSEWAALKRQGW